MFHIICAIIFGVTCGIITGITPGIHVNLVAAGVVASLPFLLTKTDPIILCIFIMSLAVAHSFLDTIPSTFLGAPNEQNSLSALPAQKMLIIGEGYSAVKITLTGAYVGLIFSILFAPLFIIIFKPIFEISKPYIKFFLLSIIIFLILREEKKEWCLMLFLLSGALGVIVLSMNRLNQPLFSLLSGLFGISGLLLSYFENTNIPQQKFTSEIDIDLSELIKTIISGLIGVVSIQFFPGTGPSQGAIVSSVFIKKIKEKTYLALIGLMGTMSAVFSITTFYSINKARDGSVVAISQIMQINYNGFLLIMISILISGSISVILTLYLSKHFSKIITLVNYKSLVITVIFFIVILSYYFDRILGLIILLSSTSIGLIAPLKNIPRSHAMGCLLLPVLLYLFS